MTLPVFFPSTSQDEIDAVAEVLRSGWLGMGPKTEQFEQAFETYLGAPHAVAVNSCTAALDLAAQLLDIGPGDEVIVPTMTFVSTAHAVCYRGATPIFADVQADTLNIDFDDALKKITPRTKAVIVVHYAGRPVDVRKLRSLISPSIPIIEDCAHAAGSSYYGKKVGSEGNISCFSFHAVKNLAMGDGGALVVPTTDLRDRARRLRWMGIDRDTWNRTHSNRDYWWRYNVTEIGQKCHMNDISAAIGLVQLRKLDALNTRRREIVHLYNEALSSVVTTPPSDSPDFQSSWHIYCIRTPRRDDLAAHLASKAISTGVHYYPIHLYPCYDPSPALPAAEEAFNSILTLPLFPSLTQPQLDQVISEIRQFHRA